MQHKLKLELVKVKTSSPNHKIEEKYYKPRAQENLQRAHSTLDRKKGNLVVQTERFKHYAE